MTLTGYQDIIFTEINPTSTTTAITMFYDPGYYQTVFTLGPVTIVSNVVRQTTPTITNLEPTTITVVPTVTDATPETKPEFIYTTTFYVGIDLTPQATKNLNISAAISHFRQVCTSWPNFKEDLHELHVVPCKK